MALWIYEMKKLFLYQKGLLFISLYFVLSIAALLAWDTPGNPEIKMNYESYAYYLDQVRGALSEEKELFLAQESKRISEANIALEKTYADYYDGNISEKELLAFSAPLQETVKNESGFKIIFDQYTYIRENPDNRYFLSTNGWSGLLSSDRLDLLFLFLLLVLITPVFGAEFSSEMDAMHLTVQKGTRVQAAVKVVLVLATVVLLCLLTSLLSYGYYHITYGLLNGDYPLQSLSFYESSTKNISLFSAFLWLSALKTCGYGCLAMLIMLLSVWTKRYALTLFSSTAAVILPYFGSDSESFRYLVPGPLGFMIPAGFFRGNAYEYNVVTEQMDATFQEIPTGMMFILLAVTLCISAGAAVVIILRHTNGWSINRRSGRLKALSKSSLLKSFRLLLVFCLAVPALAGCASPPQTENHDPYNYSSRQSFENEQYRFYVDETDLDDIKLVFQDKQTGQVKKLNRDPMPRLAKTGTFMYGNGPYVYYMKHDYEKMRGFSHRFEERVKVSIVEIDTATFHERIIFEKNLNSNKDRFLGLHREDRDDPNYYSGIDSFFLDEERIYFVAQDEIRQVHRLTGKSKVIIRLPSFRSVSYDGRYIYYLNEQYQIVKYDTDTSSEQAMPGIITTYFILTDTELLFLNRKDKYRIYALDLSDTTIRKITDRSVLSFTCDDVYIFYEGRDDLKKYRINRNGDQDTLIKQPE